MNVKEKFEKIVIDIEDIVKNEIRKASDISEQIATNMLMGYRELKDVFKFFTDRSLNEYIKERKMMAAYTLILTQDEMNIDRAIEISGLDVYRQNLGTVAGSNKHKPHQSNTRV